MSLSHPTLLPGLARVWRDAHTLQLGLDPAAAVTLQLADPRWGRMLDLLDGTRHVREFKKAAAARGYDAAAASALLGTLREAGLLINADHLMPRGLPPGQRNRLLPEAAALGLRRRLHSRLGVVDRPPAAVIRRRLGARVLVAGQGRLVTPIAAALAHAGVGHVDPALTGLVDHTDLAYGGFGPGDLQRRRASAAAEEVRRLVPEADTSPLRDKSASLVIQVGNQRPPLLEALCYRDVPHLGVSVRDGRVLIGPLVRPGLPPCFQCVELHRRDRDPVWPVIDAQLRTSKATSEPCETPIVLVGVAVVVAEALELIDGRRPRSVAATIEIVSASDQRRRTWTGHPECDCGRSRRSVSAVGGRPAKDQRSTPTVRSPQEPPLG
jgi:bacteriocin biosynthesis cyclodehydratase domain-containing protein